MSEIPTTESPLLELESSPAAIVERALLGYINLRGISGNGGTRFSSAVKKVTDLFPPVRANSLVQNPQFTLCWLGPDEYLLITEPQKSEILCERLSRLLDGVFASVIDVSSGYTTIEISGPYASTLIAKGCPMNLHPEAFRVGDCAQSLVAYASVLLFKKTDDSGFEIVVRRSYADYLMRWLFHVNNGY